MRHFDERRRRRLSLSAPDPKVFGATQPSRKGQSAGRNEAALAPEDRQSPVCLAQVLVLADVVDGNRRAQATTRAGKYLMTFSDDYLDRPKQYMEDFQRRRQDAAGTEVLEPDSSEAKDLLPVSLEKRYVPRNALRQELDYLVQHTLRHVQLPYFLDDDEKKAFDQAISEAGGDSAASFRTASWHGLTEGGCRISVVSGVTRLVTRSPVLADSIRKLFAQMQAGPAGGSTADETNTLEDLAGIELGVVKEEERRQFRPPPQSLQEDVFDPAESPAPWHWDWAPLKPWWRTGEPFFRPQTDSGSRVTRALQRRGLEEGRFDMEWDHLSYEEFEEEYVTGKGPDGKSLQLGNQGELHRYDCTDVARDLLKRAQAAQRLKDGGKKIRKFFGVYVDEVQDLLPVELLLLKLVSDRNEGFIFAGDTAQTISKGVEFRFESIRRLYYEEFCGGKQHESEVVNVKEEKSRKLRYGATPGLRKKLDSAGAGKINCPFGQDGSWEEAQKIIFARKLHSPVGAKSVLGVEMQKGHRRAVLEFGAKQVVLVWSEEKKREMKEKLTQSLVMTIHECKGLEFFDVLLVDPFSDMSGCTNESQAQQNWNLIFGVFEKFGLQVCTNEKKRAPAFVDDKHGLLCAWLKTLYVGITRARKRVWILESQEHGQSLVRFLQEMGVAQICNVGDDLAGSQGFAATSTSQEWFDMGLQMFRESGNYEQAKVAFGNAEKANFIQATPWKLLAEAEECRKPARMDHSQAGAAYVRLAEWLENALGSSQRQVQDAAKEVGVEEKNLRPSEARQRAAEGFMEAMDWSQASREFEKAGCFSDAAECADALQNWKHAGKLWRMAGEDERALKRFHRAEAWNDFVEVAEQVPVDGKLSAEVKVELITHACREMANHLKKNGRRKQDKESKSTLICCIRLLPEEDREVFLETLQWQELTMQVYEADKRYEKCAAISLEIRDWKKARQQGQANQ
ncbi:unnamed protein product [Durusdinium trenchii]|uniref:DNA helicase n=1 Tax=Durusdinium trenchii TaxID=1381693 RepID=A0ABP0JQA7_9DINO